MSAAAPAMHNARALYMPPPCAPPIFHLTSELLMGSFIRTCLASTRRFAGAKELSSIGFDGRPIGGGGAQYRLLTDEASTTAARYDFVIFALVFRVVRPGRSRCSGGVCGVAGCPVVGDPPSSSGQPMPKGHPALPTDRQVSSIPYGAFLVRVPWRVSRQSISRSPTCLVPLDGGQYGCTNCLIPVILHAAPESVRHAPRCNHPQVLRRRLPTSQRRQRLGLGYTPPVHALTQNHRPPPALLMTASDCITFVLLSRSQMVRFASLL